MANHFSLFFTWATEGSVPHRRPQRERREVESLRGGQRRGRQTYRHDSPKTRRRRSHCAPNDTEDILCYFFCSKVSPTFEGGKKSQRMQETRKSSTVSSSTLPLLVSSSPCICRRATETRNLLYSPPPSLSEGRLKKGRKRNFQKRLSLQKIYPLESLFFPSARERFLPVPRDKARERTHMCVYRDFMCGRGRSFVQATQLTENNHRCRPLFEKAKRRRRRRGGGVVFSHGGKRGR